MGETTRLNTQLATVHICNQGPLEAAKSGTNGPISISENAMWEHKLLA